ncbi:MAG: recX, partial [Acidobacteria bacterium]|nr:recX [Acidobacteriota bacterium]
MTETALDKALQLVARRPHFRAELRRKLVARGFDEDEVAAALGRLTELGYLDDAELAAREGERLRERRGLGRAGIAAELARKGAGPAEVDGALA